MDNTTVYAIKFTGDSDYTSIAMRCEYRDDPEGFTGICYLTPPDRGHMIAGAVTKETRHGFKYQSTGYAPGEWEFTALTLENFRKRFCRLVIGGGDIAQRVANTEQLYEFFNNEFQV